MLIYKFKIDIDFPTRKNINSRRREKLKSIFNTYTHNFSDGVIRIKGEGKLFVITPNGLLIYFAQNHNIKEDVRSIFLVFGVAENDIAIFGTEGYIKYEGITDEDMDPSDQAKILNKLIDIKLSNKVIPFRFECLTNYNNNSFMLSMKMAQKNIEISLSTIIDSINNIDVAVNHLIEYVDNVLVSDFSKLLGQV